VKLKATDDYVVIDGEPLTFCSMSGLVMTFDFSTAKSDIKYLSPSSLEVEK